MPMTERCGMCAHFKPIEGIFGECKEKDTVFSADPKCGVFQLNRQKAADNVAQNFADFGTRQIIDPAVLAFMGMGLTPGFVQHKCQHTPERPEPEATEWENPLYRKKKKPRKVINLAEAIAERKNK